MDNRNGKGKSNPQLDDDDVKNIDLTLKLGPSIHYNQNLEQDTNASCRGSQSSNDMGNWNVEYCRREEGRSSNYMEMVYPFPQININVTTPNRKRPNSDDTKACKACGSNTTPLWRKGPDGPQTLCNACGLRHLRTVKRGGD